MDKVWLLLYNIFVVPALWCAFHVAAHFNPKIKRGLDGRTHEPENLTRILSNRGNRQTVWIHAASLGEFEQAKPIIDLIKKHNPEIFILVTFFSPSGYEHASPSPSVDATAYIPFDSRMRAKRFVARVYPDLAIFIRYDLWLNHLHALCKAEIPAWLVCASNGNAHADSFIKQSYKKSALKNFTHISCVEPGDIKTFTQTLPEMAISADGDTKYDRVIQRTYEQEEPDAIPQRILNNKFVIVAGSTWHEDEDVLLPAFKMLAEKFADSPLLIIAPHEPSQEHVERLTNTLHACRFSTIDQYAGQNSIVVDSVGHLFSLYRYANVAFVGGGFKQGVHNVLEPAAFGVPVLYGPMFHNAREAEDLYDCGGGHSYMTSTELHDYILRSITDPNFAHNEGAKAHAFAHSHTGAAERITDRLLESGALHILTPTHSD